MIATLSSFDSHSDAVSDELIHDACDDDNRGDSEAWSTALVFDLSSVEAESQQARPFVLPPLLDLIPRPHGYAFPYPLPKVFTRFSLSMTDPEIRKYLVPRDRLNDIFKDPNAHLFWIVPVYGDLFPLVSPSVLPELASATVIRSITDKQSALIINTSSHITWSPHLLRLFWKFMLGSRKSGQLGPVSLNYVLHSKDPPCVYLKIGCLAVRAMNLRRAIDVWEPYPAPKAEVQEDIFVPSSCPSEEDDDAPPPLPSTSKPERDLRKRLLRYTGLLLMDHLSRPLCIAGKNSQ